MPKVHQIVENKKVLKYLKDRKLREQYVKAKNYLLAGLQNQVKFKEREPKGTNAWYFRVNKQYRAVGYFETKGVFVVARVDNHQ